MGSDTREPSLNTEVRQTIVLAISGSDALTISTHEHGFARLRLSDDGRCTRQLLTHRIHAVKTSARSKHVVHWYFLSWSLDHRVGNFEDVGRLHSRSVDPEHRHTLEPHDSRRQLQPSGRTARLERTY